MFPPKDHLKIDTLKRMLRDAGARYIHLEGSQDEGTGDEVTFLTNREDGPGQLGVRFTFRPDGSLSAVTTYDPLNGGK